MKKLSVIPIIFLIITLITSCTSVREEPFENENNISDFKFQPSSLRTVENLEYEHNMYFGFDIRNDNYESCTLVIDGKGFDFRLAYGNTKNMKRDTFTQVFENIEEEGELYEFFADDKLTDHFRRCIVLFTIAKTNYATDEGYITFSFTAKEKETGTEHSAKFYIYYSSNEEEIAYSTVSIYAARKDLSSVNFEY